MLTGNLYETKLMNDPIIFKLFLLRIHKVHMNALLEETINKVLVLKFIGWSLK